jgi:signal transduction histidine kinase
MAVRAPRPPGLLPIVDGAAALETAERLARLGTLLASVAHELNNPLTYLLGNLSDLEALTGAMREALAGYRRLAERELGPEGAARATALEAKLAQLGGTDVCDELLEDANEGLLRIRTLVGDVLGLCHNIDRAGDGQCRPLDVHEVLESTLRLVRRELEQCAHLELDWRAGQAVCVDAARLGQVLLNLLSNARDACQPPDPERHRIAVRTYDCDGTVRIEVEDSGVGIAEGLRAKIFSPFFSTKPVGAGTGLGLFISRQLVEEHGGTLQFEAAPQGGTLFRVSLPAAEAAPPAAADAAPTE